MKVYPYPGYEDTYWEVTYRFYLPSFPLQEKKQYYLAATCYDLAEPGNESDLSNIIIFAINPPGLAGEAVLDGNPPEASGASQGSTEILFSIFMIFFCKVDITQ